MTGPADRQVAFYVNWWLLSHDECKIMVISMFSNKLDRVWAYISSFVQGAFTVTDRYIVMEKDNHPIKVAHKVLVRPPEEEMLAGYCGKNMLVVVLDNPFPRVFWDIISSAIIFGDGSRCMYADEAGSMRVKEGGIYVNPY